MLQIKDISKQYKTGDLVQQALNSVSLNLRDNEFVAILGPSGSGKTTLLNIIGGLDRYDSGDLIINGVSTKKYTDRDWDSYRNHTVGFVFQSYNLIPHQTVLQNVELALTIGGISKRERRKMALDALERVGLKEQAHKKPNQMSGGQMQRVAIARALVNNPSILLADEPTGALDTNTSIQVMDLLKEVAKDRLVVMVTHNPELAEEYANRIVRLRDGVITDDSNPLVIENEEPAVHKNLGKASMSIFTSFGLSLKNLLTKKGRTILTAFAGSIGIIGIALILSLSTGFQNYIDQIQEETMTSYPLTLTSETTDLYSAILTMRGDTEREVADDELVEQMFITSLVGAVSKNDLESFKCYLESTEEEYGDYINLIKYSYSVSPVIYTIDAADNLAQINPSQGMSAMMGGSSMAMMSGSGMGSVFSEMTDIAMTMENNDLLTGCWPEKYNELLVVVSDPHQISDLLMYSLGFRDTKELRTLISSVMMGEDVDTDATPMTITYDDLLNLELKLIDPSDKYVYNEKYDIYEDMSDDKAFMAQVYENAEPLKIVGIATTKTDGPAIAAGIMYLPELTGYVMARAADSEIVQKQMANRDVDVFSGNPFDEDREETGLDFQDMISIDEDLLAEAFQVNISTDGLFNEADMQKIIMASAQLVSENLEKVTQQMVTALTTIDQSVAEGLLQTYITRFSGKITDFDMSQLEGMLAAKTAARPQTDGPRVVLLSEGGPDGEIAIPADKDADAPVSGGGSTEPAAPSGGGTEQPSGGSGTTSGGGSEPQTPPTDPGTPPTAPGGDTPGTGEGGQPGEGGEDDPAENTDPDSEEDPDGENGDGDDLPDSPPDDDTKDPPATLDLDLNGEYLLISFGGTHLPEVYKAYALSDEAISALQKEMSDLKISAENLRKIVGEAFDIYFASLATEDYTIPFMGTLTVVPKDKVPSPAAAVKQALKNNKALIHEESCTLAKSYTTLLVAQGIGQAVAEITGPLSSMFSGEIFSIDSDKFAEAFHFDMDEDELSRLMETMLSGSNTSYSSNLLSLGYQDPDDPTTISFYFKDFESKGNFMEFLDSYNENAEEEKQISYTDLTGLLMGSVETIINSVTYVLIAFVSISLVVSSIMIGIITYISVLERTKEIGILRAIGASKRNVSSIFNAETFIIGLLSGLIGVGMTYLLNIPVNHIIHTLTDNPDITAVLPTVAAAALVVIATVLTMIGGLIPSRSASKKDPVIALRTE